MAVDWRGDEFVARTHDALEHGLDVLANKIVVTAQRSMRLPKHGKHYRGRITRSSAPYEAPAVQTGRLINSVQYVQPRRLVRHVGSFGLTGRNAQYPLYLEIGTSKMDERPWLRPALYVHTGRLGEEIFRDLF